MIRIGGVVESAYIPHGKGILDALDDCQSGAKSHLQEEVLGIDDWLARNGVVQAATSELNRILASERGAGGVCAV